eukprot:131781-Amphidinium_carterae.1
MRANIEAQTAAQAGKTKSARLASNLFVHTHYLNNFCAGTVQPTSPQPHDRRGCRAVNPKPAPRLINYNLSNASQQSSETLRLKLHRRLRVHTVLQGLTECSPSPEHPGWGGNRRGGDPDPKPPPSLSPKVLCAYRIPPCTMRSNNWSSREKGLAADT